MSSNESAPTHASATGGHPLHVVLSKVVAIRPDELRAALLSFAYFFLLLGAYYVLRPVRDEMGVQAGTQQLRWLFTAVFVSMLVLIPVFGWLASRLSVRRMIPGIYVFFAVNLVGFYCAWVTDAPRVIVASAFFVWVSVFNLFVVSVFWSFMADLFSTDSAHRLFGFISAGGSAGAITAPLCTALLVPMTGIAPLLLISATLVLAALLCFYALLNLHRTQPTHDSSERRQQANPMVSKPSSVWIGLLSIARSNYLIGICVYLLCYSFLSTVIYFQQTDLVPRVIADPNARTQLFALVDLAVNSTTVLIQLFLTGRLLQRLGVTTMLLLLPAWSVVGFVAFGLAPILLVLIVFGVVRRAMEFALAKPTRESLFTVVTHDQKYQAKNVIDTVVHRGGDMTSGWIVNGLHGAGLSLAGIALAAVPLAGLWLIDGLWLGRRHERLCREHNHTSSAITPGETDVR